MRNLIIYLAALLFTIAHSSTFASSSKDFPRIDRCVNPTLQQQLELGLASLKLDSQAQKKNLCIALVDVTDSADPQVALVNGNHMMYAASLPKIAILLGAFEQIEKGSIPADRTTYDTLTRMIRKSSNRAATTMLNRVGMDFLSDLLQSPKYRLYDTNKNGGLWVGKEYGKNPAKKRDPLHNLSHGATVLQVARYYYLLDTGRLVSPEQSQEMKKILGNPGIHHKFVKGLEERRPGAKIFRKSGSWRDYHSDSALIERDGHRYIAVALAKSPKGGAWLSKIIVALDDIITGSSS